LAPELLDFAIVTVQLVKVEWICQTPLPPLKLVKTKAEPVFWLEALLAGSSPELVETPMALGWHRQDLARQLGITFDQTDLRQQA
jgi:hypothetical protein